MVYFYAFLIAVGFVLLLMPSYIKLMLRHRVLDRSGGRKIHQGEKVNMGGIVIFLGFAASYLFSMPVLINSVSIDLVLEVIILLSIVLIVGVRDDMNSLTPLNKVVVEIIIGYFLFKIGVKIESFYGLFGIYEIPDWLSLSISIFFLIVITNAFNLIDGVDGQSGTQAIVTIIPLFLFFAFMVPRATSSALVGSPILWSLLSISLIGAIFAYLFYNWEPSKVFMGDTGSLVIGTILSILIIVGIQYNGYYGDEITIAGAAIKSNIGVVVMFFFLPLADTLRVMSARLMKKQSPFYPDKTHVHHFILRTGGTHRESALTTMTISIVITIIGLYLATKLNDNYFIPLMIVLFAVYVLTLIWYTNFRVKRLKKNNNNSNNERS